MSTFDKAVIAVMLGGLLLTGIGATITANAVIITNEQADRLGATLWDGNPAVAESYKAQSRSARNGLLLIVVGTILQAIGTAAPFFRS